MKSSRSDTSNSLDRLDAVKLELAVVVGLIIGVLLVIWRVEMSHWVDLGLLALTGFGAGGWVAWRTRLVLRDHDDGA
ncbi:hypothetical protein [Spiribacter vilamensis]|uniref:Uncharacterized protein n=1 Tax=Spiribacter vilamensis TaxID=531306 RepID=A0A4Q8D0P7_9GAMM|nr:hypothetical protein [Spiribacter vilamensis]RZU98878.1 hypothetical protein EV698_1142 [Spiribacter vilamensis]TVO62107.1 hypothetical protein FPL09_08505 [Spiribacter vilamensis]